MILRDGSKTLDPRCGLIFSGETEAVKSLYSLPPTDGGIDLRKRPLINKRRIRNLSDAPLEQHISSCVGMGITNMLEHERGISSRGSEWATELYFEVQRHDAFPGGEYEGADPVAGGTSIYDALVYAKKAGLILDFVRARTMDEVLSGICYHSSGAILGLDFTEGMMVPDEQGLCRPTGRSVGGHCIFGRDFYLDRGIVRGPNSWPGWNPWLAGDWAMTVKDLDYSLRRGGECWFAVKA